MGKEREREKETKQYKKIYFVLLGERKKLHNKTKNFQNTLVLREKETEECTVIFLFIKSWKDEGCEKQREKVRL